MKRQFLFSGAFLLTLCSLIAASDFYFQLFGGNLFRTLLLLVTIELVRFGILWFYVWSDSLNLYATLPLYLITAFMCAFGGVVSYEQRLMNQTKPIENELNRRVQLVKRAYTDSINHDVATLESKMETIRVRLAQHRADSLYWQARLGQRTRQVAGLRAELDGFLAQNPDDKEAWVSANAPLAGLEFEPLGYNTTVRAVQEVFGLSEAHTHRLISVLIVVTVESGILLFAFLAAEVRRKENPDLQRMLRVMKRRDLAEFLTRCQASLNRSGSLPADNRSSERQRKVLAILRRQDAGAQDIQDLLDGLNGEYAQVQK